MSKNKVLKKKLIILIIGSGYIVTYIKKAVKKKFNIKLISRKKFLIKKRIKNIDMIFHTIGLNRYESIKNPKKANLVKKEYTDKIIKFAKINKVPKIVYFSSALIYSKSFTGKINENTKCRNNEPYAKDHLFAEKILKLNARKNLKIIILRVSNLFGINCTTMKRFAYYGANNFIKDAIQNKKITITEKFAVRNFIPMDYLVKIIPRLNLYNDKIKIINLGYKEYSLINMAKLISKRVKKLLNYSPKIESHKINHVKNLTYNSIYLNKKNEHKLFIKQIDNAIIIIKKQIL